LPRWFRQTEEARIADYLGECAGSRNGEVADLAGRIVKGEEGIEFRFDLVDFHVAALLEPQFSMK
jgi:hypothetical protein